MKKWDLVFAPKRILVLLLLLLLLFSIMLGASITYAQELQSGSRQEENARHVEEANTDKVYKVWMLAVRYKFEETIEEQEIAHDPSIMKEIASLRGDDLGYFLDSIEAINQVQTIMFPPSSPDSKPTASITVSEESELVKIVTVNVFSAEKEDIDLAERSERDQAYATELQAILNAIVKGNGNSFFTVKYLEYRARIIPFIEDTGTELFNPSQEAINSYLEYFGIDEAESVDLDPNHTQAFGCPTTNTIDNWPSKSSIYSGNTGSSWYEGSSSDQNDCDIWIRYYMGAPIGGPHYGQISAGTTSAQCVLDKTAQLRGDWSGSLIYNYVQYGKNTVTWWWPLGCNTTGSALMSGTKWRP